MTNPERTKSNTKPEVLEDLKNGYWFYNYDIKESDPQDDAQQTSGIQSYDFIQARISGEPTYKKCVIAVLRQYVSESEEFDYINSYNSYQLGLGCTEDYQEYLKLLEEIKSNVRKDFNMEPEQTVQLQSAPVLMISKAMTMAINTMSLTDQQALEVMDLYPQWSTFIGQTIKKDTKVQYESKLFKVVQDHLVQEQYPPSVATASLYVQIVESQSGTKDDPIDYPADGNLVIYNGKYYKEDGKLYKCIRDSGNPLYTKLANVVGNYVELA